MNSMHTKTAKKQQGDAFEHQAVRLLQAQGYQIVATNYSLPKIGEIDVVATTTRMVRERSMPYLVFVEVRSRRESVFGGAIHSITGAKVARLRRTAEHFLQTHDGFTEHSVRFDVMTFDIHQDGTVSHEWLKDAF